MMETGEEAIPFCDHMLKQIYYGLKQPEGEDMITRKMTMEDVPVICREEAAQGWHPSKGFIVDMEVPRGCM